MYELPHSIKQITDLSHSIKQENQLTVIYHWASYRHVTLNYTGKLRIFQNPLNRNMYELPHSIKQITDLSHSNKQENQLTVIYH
jgi:hypothetical protein